jgi:hypothetical protein
MKDEDGHFGESVAATYDGTSGVFAPGMVEATAEVLAERRERPDRPRTATSVAAPERAALHRGAFNPHPSIASLKVAAPERAALHRGEAKGGLFRGHDPSPPLSGRPFIEAGP